MPPRRNNRVNNEADPPFTAAVVQAVADLLPTLTARITDEIRQNENNGNNGNRRNARRVNTEGSRNDEDVQPTDIHVWLERFQKQKPQTFSSASTSVEAENRIAHIEKIFEVLGCGHQFKARLVAYKLEDDAHSWWMAYKQAKGGDTYVAMLSWNDFCYIFFLNYFPYSEKEKCERESKNEGNNKRDIDGHRIRSSNTPAQGSNQRAYDQRDSDRYGNGGRYGNKDRYGNNRGRSDRQGSDRHGNGSDKRGTSTQRVWRDKDQQTCHKATGACFECGDVGHLAKDCKKGSTNSRGNKNNKPHATSGRVFALTTEQATNAPGDPLGSTGIYD
nr:hypothetical protein [Tanacetum cinerariifolium]